ncbi:hypothetical protein KKD19_05040 [Patescibacteria group bacterium]|nr:hypothetical protein [Patescibacteria group bacterium]MBU4512573.1 hypothetical protein [Patescibacteria group bacterium]MCG2692814.1 hypothetical protein [Candidatus Parcubacteria bacterium]
MPKATTNSEETKETKTDTPIGRVGRQKKKGHGKWLFVVVVIVIVAGGGYLINNYFGAGIGSSSEWQAVFLTNGQVYFGHVKDENKSTVVLRDIYYLQVTEALQQADQGGERANELSLVKLGNELHGPKDEMRIVRTNVLFIEDLMPDSKVVLAIENYLADQE